MFTYFKIVCISTVAQLMPKEVLMKIYSKWAVIQIAAWENKWWIVCLSLN